MIISNATISRIDAPPVSALNGTLTYTEGASTAIRCAWQRPRTGQKWILGATINNAAAVVYVNGNQTGVIVPGGRLVVLVDGESVARTYRILAVEPQVGQGMNHTEVYLENL